jgi:hypothetical protein
MVDTSSLCDNCAQDDLADTELKVNAMHSFPIFYLVLTSNLEVHLDSKKSKSC